jgi:uncharacterized protein YbaP (TraB family)
MDTMKKIRSKSFIKFLGLLSSALIVSCVTTPSRSLSSSLPYLGSDSAADPFLWKVSKQGKTSYFFGTLHGGVDPKHDIAPIVWQKLDQASTVVIEAEPQYELHNPHNLTRKFFRVYIYEDLRSVEDPTYLEESRKAGEIVKMYPLEWPLHAVAEDQGKELLYLEDLESFQESTGRDPKDPETFVTHTGHKEEQIRSVYLSHDEEGMEHLEFNVATVDPDYYEDIIYKRHDAWMKKLVPILTKGDAFIMIGAGHFYGPGSLLKEFKKQGYTVENISNPRILDTTTSLDEMCDRIEPAITAEIANPIVELTRDYIHEGVMENGEKVPRETPEERSKPLLPERISTCIVKVAAISAQSAACGNKYEEAVYLPFMKMSRKEFKPSDKQSAFAGLIHGMSVGWWETHTVATKNKDGKCEAITETALMSGFKVEPS